MSSFNIETGELYKTVKFLRDNGCAFQYFDDSYFNGRTIQVNGKELLHFASCSYLGLETHPALINAAIEAVKKFGTQTALANYLGVTRQYLSIVKHGKQNPKWLIDRIIDIAKGILHANPN